MDEMKLDRVIRETMHGCADGLEAPDKLKTRVDFALKSGVKPARSKMRTWKRTAVALCAALAVVVVGAFASGQITSWGTSLRLDKNWTDFDKTASFAEKHVPDMKYVESFSNGYAFQKGWEDTVDKRDDANNTLESFTGLRLKYGKEDASVSLEAAPVQADGVYVSPFDTVREIDGIEVHYREMLEIFLPADGSIRPTAEEQAKCDAGEINIAYGTDQREQDTFYSVRWIEDGMSYMIYATNSDVGSLTADDFFAMAAEVIGK